MITKITEYMIVNKNATRPTQSYWEALYLADKKIDAIKEVRGLTSWGLKESKDFVEENWGKGRGLFIESLGPAVKKDPISMKKDILNALTFAVENCDILGFESPKAAIETILKNF